MKTLPAIRINLPAIRISEAAWTLFHSSRYPLFGLVRAIYG